MAHVLNLKSGETWDNIPVLRGPQGNQPDIAVTSNTDTEYKLTFTSNGVPLESRNLRGSAFFSGDEIDGTSTLGYQVEIAGSQVHDIYVNNRTDAFYIRTDKNQLGIHKDNFWMYKGNLKGNNGDNFYEVWKTIPGNEGKTKQQMVEEMSGTALAMYRVYSKPLISESTTELQTWYYYKTGEDFGGMYHQDLYLSHVSSLAAGNYTMKVTSTIDDSEVYRSFTITDEQAALCPAVANHKYCVQMCYGSVDCAVSFYEEPYSTGIYEATIKFTFQSTESEEAPVGYTVLEGAATQMSNKAWKWESTLFPAEMQFEVAKYAFFDGIRYLSFDNGAVVEPTPGVRYFVIYDEKLLKLTFWGEIMATGHKVLLTPYNIDITLTENLPAGAIDMSGICDLVQLGTWTQTIYMSSTSLKADAFEVTIETGASFSGVVQKTTFDSVVGTAALTTDASDCKGAINELNAEKLDKYTVVSNNGKIMQAVEVSTPDGTKYENMPSLAISDILEVIYPVGSVYINTTDINPMAILGFGTWERICSNATIWGASADGEVGTVKAAGLPKVGAKITYRSPNRTKDDSSVSSIGCLIADTGTTVTDNSAEGSWSRFDKNGIGAVAITESSGGRNFNAVVNGDPAYYGKSDTVQPPALVVNIWKRTA